ncbi:uncharacterized protein I303_107250 [Kwoniella dejecticola CBS 10117]|uniref:TPX2 C-terminal domain-containing protein n=1 Tax=Kwoniella dejecticola CBS 10117 TaxID=1296121 RepID=A0A1A5ZZ53_9TREE|nr:uncharacterized protein I303_06652 [Kwoniella dejecticola CBS 10117]OBR83093.1 hypothetical protein I303_06652 [Kwoniella dejecticola CBS 10117]
MQSQPPQTPWVGLPRFQDESLLIDGLPIFDVSLGDDLADATFGLEDVDSTPTKSIPASASSSAASAQSQSQTAQKTNADVVDISLDLGDYLPEEEVTHQYTSINIQDVEQTRRLSEMSDCFEESRRRPESQSQARGQIQSKPREISHKREGSHSRIPVAGPSKKAKPPIEKKDDDLYKRRLSDSLRRSSSANLYQLASSQSHISILARSSAKAPKSTQVEVSVKTASSRSKSGLQNQPSQSTVNSGTKAHDHIDIADGEVETPHIPDRVNTSALTRYLSKSAIPTPSSSSPKDTSISSNNLPAYQEPEQRKLSPSTSASTIDESTSILPPVANHSFTSVRHGSPFELSSSVSEASSSHTHLSDSSKNSRISVAQSTSSRRSSMSEKVVGFFSNLLTRSASSSSLRHEAMFNDDAEEEDKGEGEGEDGNEEDPQEDTARFDEYEAIYRGNKIDGLGIESSQTTHDQSQSHFQEQPEPETASHTAESQTNATMTGVHIPGFKSLTKPIPFSRPLHVRQERPPSKATSQFTAADAGTTSSKPRFRAPLQPSGANNTGKHPSASTSSTKLMISKPTNISSSTTLNKSHRPIVRTSAFASAAIAKLPPPGKGHLTSTSSQPVSIKSSERVGNLNDRRNVFERLADTQSVSSRLSKTSGRAGGSQRSNNAKQASVPANSRNSSSATTLTVPIRGHTPGKASTIRSHQRARFDAIVQEKQRAKQHEEDEVRRKQAQEEEEEYQRRRKETVIWAKPVPDMYRS